MPAKPKTDRRRYTLKQKDDICTKVLDFMCEGISVSQSCIKAGVPKQTFLKWTINDATLRSRYDTARQAMYDSMAEDIVHIADDPADMVVAEDGAARRDSAHVSQKRLQVDSRKWLLSKLAPKKYGDRVSFEDADGNTLMSMFSSIVKEHNGGQNESE